MPIFQEKMRLSWPLGPRNESCSVAMDTQVLMQDDGSSPAADASGTVSAATSPPTSSQHRIRSGATTANDLLDTISVASSRPGDQSGDESDETDQSDISEQRRQLLNDVSLHFSHFHAAEVDLT